jgi:dTDP-4-amino-4,6-dideoxygalactose transaminase
MNIPFLDLARQYTDIKSEIDSAIQRIIDDTAFIGGRAVQEFEAAFAEFCGVKHCVGVGNGTDAIFIALRALGLKPGDEVIVPANSFIATSEAVTLAGGQVVFADIDPRTYNIDPKSIEARITPRTRVIIPVHLYGQPADMDPILELAKRHGLLVLEDAAQAHGAEYKGRLIGSIGDAACFSFYPGKNLGAYGDAGAIVSRHEEVATRARMLANHGRIDKYNHEIEGVNSRLDGIQAAILSVKLKHLPTWTKLRRQNAHRYNELLAGSGAVTPVELPGATAVYHLYVIRVDAEVREDLRTYLQQQGVNTGIHYPIALPNLLAYRHLNHTPQDFPEATRASAEILSLPMFAELTEEQLQCVSQKVATGLAARVARATL